jgi:hypothetical protein
MTTTNPPTNIPLPTGAVRVCPWDDVEHGDPHRYWVGSSRKRPHSENRSLNFNRRLSVLSGCHLSGERRIINAAARGLSDPRADLWDPQTGRGRRGRNVGCADGVQACPSKNATAVR